MIVLALCKYWQDTNILTFKFRIPEDGRKHHHYHHLHLDGIDQNRFVYFIHQRKGKRQSWRRQRRRRLEGFVKNSVARPADRRIDGSTGLRHATNEFCSQPRPRDKNNWLRSLLNICLTHTSFHLISSLSLCDVYEGASEWRTEGIVWVGVGEGGFELISVSENGSRDGVRERDFVYR